MFNFSFNKNKVKVAKDTRQPMVFNLSQLLAQQEEADNNEYDKKRQEKSRQKIEHLDAPYAIYSGDPDYHVTRNPNVEPGKWNFVHHTEIGNDRTGRSIARDLKSELEKIDSPYEKTFLSPDQYAHDEKMTKLAPKGMLGYRLKKENQPIRSDNTSIREFHQVLNNAEIRGKMRQRVGELPSINAPEFDPTHPLNLIATHGGQTAIKKMFTDQVPYLTANPGENICVFGREASKHTDEATASEHHGKIGEHLETHEFTPQYVNTGDGEYSKGSESRASQSPLRFAALPSTDKDGNRTLKSRKVDEGMNAESMPMVLVGTSAAKFNRVTTSEPPGTINNFQKANVSRTKCSHCTNGRVDPYKRSNNVHCENCMPGKITMKTINENGKEKGIPYTVGMGGGKVRYLDQKDAPNCENCKGKGYTLSKDKTASDLEIPCRACKSTGKQIETVEGSGTQCTNCNSHNSSIDTTPGNSCKYCDGKGYSKEETVKIPQNIKLDVSKTPFEGNPIIMRPFSKESSEESTGVDGYLGHGKKSCTRCHGNDEYQTEDGKPCNCRIGSFSNEDHIVAPKGSRYIFPDHIELPADHFLKALASVYPDHATNPHSIKDLNNTSDPITGTSPNNPTGHRYETADGKNYEAHKFTHLWNPGVSVTPDMLAELNKQSAVHHSSKNAKYTAASADLELVTNFVRDNLQRMPINITGRKQSIMRKTEALPGGRTNPKSFHPAVQPAISKVESAIDELGDSDREKFSPLLDDVYQKASHVAHDREVTGKLDSPHYDEYQKSIQKVLSTVSRFHGDEKAQKVQKAFTSLPNQPVPPLETVNEENVNA